MNTERILKENVLLNFNIDFNERDRWDREDSLVSHHTFTVVIPLNNMDKDVSVRGLYAAFDESYNEISISKDEVKIKVFTGACDFLNCMKDIYEYVQSTVKNVSNTLEELRVEDFKLICDFYTWFD